MKTLLAAGVGLLLPTVVAHADVVHNGSVMEVVTFPDHIATSYIAPRPVLYSVGVHPGTTILAGSFSGDAFHGRAWVFSRCGDFDYLVDGGLAPNGDLVVEGPEPDIRTDCGIYGAKWGSNSHLVFTEVGQHLAPPPIVVLPDTRPNPGTVAIVPPDTVVAPGKKIDSDNMRKSNNNNHVNSPDQKFTNDFRPEFKPRIEIIMPPGQPASPPPEIRVDGKPVTKDTTPN
jgi:hypothetical protein